MYNAINERLNRIVGLAKESIGYRHIVNPSAPYLTWYIGNETFIPDDTGRVYTHSAECTIELCTIEKRTDLEREIERLFLDYTLSKNEDYDYSEDVYVITYTFVATKKGKRKNEI